MKESAIQLAIRLALGAESDCAFWRNNVGSLEVLRPSGHVERVTYGLCKGSGDLIGIAPVRRFCPACGTATSPVGAFVSLEVKQPGKYPTPEQRMFAENVRRLGGVAATVHSAEEALEVLRKGKP